MDAVKGALVLADGTVFSGTSAGAEGTATGEVVFNTAMTGYQEIATDPSYAGQILSLIHISEPTRLDLASRMPSYARK